MSHKFAPIGVFHRMIDGTAPTRLASGAAADSAGLGRSARTPTSAVLDELLGVAPAETVTLGWLIGRLGDRSFGVVLLLLGLLGLLPGIATLAAVLLLVPAFEMMLANRGPVFTQRLDALHFGTRRLVALIHRAVPVLTYLERFIRPRWPTPFEATKRVVGIVVLLLGLSMLAPIPFSNVPPAILVILIAFAYLEEDGALLCVTLGAALIMLAMLGAVVWQTVSLADALSGRF